MSSQPPFDPSCQQVSPASYGPPGISVPAAPSEYILPEIPDSTPRPMPRPAYLYPLPYTPVVLPAPSRWPAKKLALAGFLLGLASTLLWFLPCLGDAVSMLGLVVSILGWRTPTRKWMAILGCALSTAALALSVYNSALGGYIFPH